MINSGPGMLMTPLRRKSSPIASVVDPASKQNDQPETDKIKSFVDGLTPEELMQLSEYVMQKMQEEESSEEAPPTENTES